MCAHFLSYYIFIALKYLLPVDILIQADPISSEGSVVVKYLLNVPKESDMNNVVTAIKQHNDSFAGFKIDPSSVKAPGNVTYFGSTIYV